MQEPETIDRLEKLNDAIAKAIEKFGESIEGYVDPRELYLSDETANKILESDGDYFYDMISDYYPDVGDEYYSDHYEFIVDYLGLNEDEKEEYEDDIYEAMRENIYVDFNYDEALDRTELKINVAWTSTKVDYICGWQSFEYEPVKSSTTGQEKLVYAPDDYDDVLKLFGYRLSDYKSWFNNTLKKKRDASFYRFMECFNEEIANSGQGFDQVVFGVKMTLREALSMKKAKSITIEPDGICGFLNTWNGGGSLLELYPGNPVTLDLTKDNIYFYIDGFSGYGIDQIYGMSSDAWECNYTINGVEDEK